MQTLVRFNVKMGFVHLIQAIVMVLIALFVLEDLQEFEPAIVAFYQDVNADTLELFTTQRELFTLPFALVTTGFLFLSAFFHFLVALRKHHYLDGIYREHNVYRWVEYALSSSLLIVLLAVLFGVRDIQSLFLIFTANAVMNLLGLEMELANSKYAKTRWLPYHLGWLIGLAPWVVIGMYLGFGGSLDLVPWYAWTAIGAYFFFFNSFAFNMLFQYRKKGRYESYVFGERVYIWLSLIAKSVIAWIVFTGALQASDIISDLF